MFGRKLIAATLAVLIMFPAGIAAGKSRSTEAESRETLPMLREAVTVEGKMVYLGDLFLNVGDKADAVVAYAPPPGQRAIFDARWLYRVARSMRLKWRPISARQQVIVERASQVIPREAVEDTILAALIDKGADPSSEIELSNLTGPIHVDSRKAPTISIDNATFDPRTGRFLVTISAPANDPAADRLQLSGKVYKVVQVPVPARNVERGEVIQKDDVKWMRVRVEKLPPDAVTQVDELVGMAPRRSMRADSFVRASEVQRPVLVERGGLVTMQLIYKQMALTAQGKALENGSMGDTVRIRNTRSKTVVEAEVIGNGRVRVQVMTTRELAQAR